MNALTQAVAAGTVGQAETRVALENLRSSIGELREDVVSSAASIQKGHDDASAAFKERVTARGLTRREWLIAALCTLVGPLTTGLLIYAITGGHH